MLFVVQVIIVVVGGVMATTGGAIFCVMTCAAVAVQPIDEVTVTVYVPGVVTFKVAFVPTTIRPFDHE
jgi:hypothetical protein